MAIYNGFFPSKMVIFHSYVSLPEGILNEGNDETIKFWGTLFSDKPTKKNDFAND